MQSYCMAHYPHQWYRHWVGFSQQYPTLQGDHYALDVYWQTPSMMYGSVWIWYVMMDQCELADYWKGRIMYFNGRRDMGPVLVRPSML